MGLILGLTGGIGSGKSTVLSAFSSLDSFTLSADSLNKKLLRFDKTVIHEITQTFGSDVVLGNGVICSRKLANIVFANDTRRHQLEAIMQPRIIAEIKTIIELFRQEHRSDLLVVEIPLLFECSLEYLVDKVLVVTAEQDIRISRLKSSRNMSREDIESRMSKQLSSEEQLRRADYVIYNNGDMKLLNDEVKKLWHLLQDKTCFYK